MIHFLDFTMNHLILNFEGPHSKTKKRCLLQGNCSLGTGSQMINPPQRESLMGVSNHKETQGTGESGKWEEMEPGEPGN